jgi:hypothetical protein
MLETWLWCDNARTTWWRVYLVTEITIVSRDMQSINYSDRIILLTLILTMVFKCIILCLIPMTSLCVDDASFSWWWQWWRLSVPILHCLCIGIHCWCVFVGDISLDLKPTMLMMIRWWCCWKYHYDTIAIVCLYGIAVCVEVSVFCLTVGNLHLMTIHWAVHCACLYFDDLIWCLRGSILYTGAFCVRVDCLWNSRAFACWKFTRGPKSFCWYSMMMISCWKYTLLPFWKSLIPLCHSLFFIWHFWKSTFSHSFFSVLQIGTVLMLVYEHGRLIHSCDEVTCDGGNTLKLCKRLMADTILLQYYTFLPIRAFCLKVFIHFLFIHVISNRLLCHSIVIFPVSHMTAASAFVHCVAVSTHSACRREAVAWLSINDANVWLLFK